MAATYLVVSLLHWNVTGSALFNSPLGIAKMYDLRGFSSLPGAGQSFPVLIHTGESGDDETVLCN